MSSSNLKNPNVILLTHKYGLRKILSLPNVKSAIHVQKKVYEETEKGKVSTLKHVLQVTLKGKEEVVREFRFNNHPDNMSVNEYNQIIENLSNYESKV